MKTRINHPDVSSPNPHVAAGVVCGGWFFVSGQGPLDMVTRQPVPGSIEEETHRTLQNIEAILVAGGATLEHVVKCSCFLSDLADFRRFDSVYREFFSRAVPPVRTTVGTPLLAGIRVEIDVIARLPEGANSTVYAE